jgi:hypothetical protein
MLTAELFPELQFWATGIALVIPAFKFKSYLLKVPILILAYPIWMLSALNAGIPATRVIGALGYPYYESHVNYAFICALSAYVAFLSSIWTRRANEFLLDIGSMPKILLRTDVQAAIVLFYLILLPIGFPGAFGLSETRYGYAASLIPVTGALLLISLWRKNPLTAKVVLTLSAVYMILNGERADFMLIALAALIKTKDINENQSIAKLFLFGIFAISLGTVGGLLRAQESFSAADIINLVAFAITNLGTAVDATHVYLSSVWYTENIGYNWLPVLNILGSYLSVPGVAGASSDYNTAIILEKFIPNLGGGLFYSAGQMSMDYLGVVVISYLYGKVYVRLLEGNWMLFTFGLAALFMQFRLQWYGLTYFGTPFLIFIVVAVFQKLIAKSKSKLVWVKT